MSTTYYANLILGFEVKESDFFSASIDELRNRS